MYKDNSNCRLSYKNGPLAVVGMMYDIYGISVRSPLSPMSKIVRGLKSKVQAKSGMIVNIVRERVMNEREEGESRVQIGPKNKGPNMIKKSKGIKDQSDMFYKW